MDIAAIIPGAFRPSKLPDLPALTRHAKELDDRPRLSLLQAVSLAGGTLERDLRRLQFTGLPSTSILWTSPRFKERMSASTLLMSPTTTQIRWSGKMKR